VVDVGCFDVYEYFVDFGCCDLDFFECGVVLCVEDYILFS